MAKRPISAVKSGKKAAAPTGSMGTRLRDARKLRKLSQVQLAAAIEVTQASVSRYERDLDVPGGAQMMAILRTLEIQWLWLKDGTGAMDAPAPAIVDEAIEIARRIEQLSPTQRRRVFAIINPLPSIHTPPAESADK
jgi:transcriptional regulator with XRE-family HTH domain